MNAIRWIIRLLARLNPFRCIGWARRRAEKRAWQYFVFWMVGNNYPGCVANLRRMLEAQKSARSELAVVRKFVAYARDPSAHFESPFIISGIFSLIMDRSTLIFEKGGSRISESMDHSMAEFARSMRVRFHAVRLAGYGKKREAELRAVQLMIRTFADPK